MLLYAAACAHPVDPPPAASSAPSAAPAPAAPSSPSADAASGIPELDEDDLAALLENPGEGPLVVNFWATWCGPCVSEMRVFAAVAADVQGARFALVSVDSARDAARVDPFLRSKGVFLPAYHLDVEDPSPVLARHVSGWPDIIPVTLVLEPGGAERARFEGAVEEPALRAALAR